MRKHTLTASVTSTFGLVLAAATAAVFFGASTVDTTGPATTGSVSVVADGPIPTPTPTASKDNTPWG
jgi:hypothetical protein